MADGDAPTNEQRLECKVRMLERRVRSQAQELRRLETILIERKQALTALGYAWSTRGAKSSEGELTEEEVKRLVATVDRIQARYFATAYTLKYESLDALLRKRCESLMKSWVDACGQKMVYYRRAKRWKALAKKLRRASLDRRPAGG